MSLEERVARIETKIETKFDNMNNSIGEIKDAIVVLTELQKENITQDKRIESTEKDIQELKVKAARSEEFQYEIGCPQLKVSNAAIRRVNENLDDLEIKMKEIYPITSRVVTILDSAVTKIIVPVIVGSVTFFGYLIWEGKQ